MTTPAATAAIATATVSTTSTALTSTTANVTANAATNATTTAPASAPPTTTTTTASVSTVPVATTGSLLSKSLENEEWEEFLDGTLADAMENPQTLEQRDLVAVVVTPLRNVNASPSLVERIAMLLAVPWAGLDREEPADEETIIRAYADTRVVPNLLYACKIMVQRRSADNRSTG